MANDEDRAADREGAEQPPEAPRSREAEATPFTQQVGRVAVLVIAALFAVFAIVNREDVRFDWIFGDPWQVPLIVLLVGSFLVGALVAWIWAARAHRRHHRGDAEQAS